MKESTCDPPHFLQSTGRLIRKVWCCGSHAIDSCWPLPHGGQGIICGACGRIWIPEESRKVMSRMHKIPILTGLVSSFSSTASLWRSCDAPVVKAHQSGGSKCPCFWDTNRLLANKSHLVKGLDACMLNLFSPTPFDRCG